MKILFICKYNRFRSKIAEAYFNKVNKDKEKVAKSAGIIFDGSIPNEKEIQSAKEFGIEINQNFQAVSTDLLDWADLIVIAANDIPKEIFKKSKGYDKEIQVWEITDDHKSNDKTISKIIQSIIFNVDTLIQKLILENK